MKYLKQVYLWGSRVKLNKTDLIETITLRLHSTSRDNFKHSSQSTYTMTKPFIPLLYQYDHALTILNLIKIRLLQNNCWIFLFPLTFHVERDDPFVNLIRKKQFLRFATFE